MTKKVKTLDELFHETLKDIYYAENKLTKAILKMAKAAQSKDLKKAFEKHAVETKAQVVRL
jgi:ferritin-like metal-binding protein YciE